MVTDLKAESNSNTKIQVRIDNLVTNWELAHKYYDSDPKSALTKARIAAEEICKHLYLVQRHRYPDNAAWSKDVHRKMLGELTPLLDKHRVVPRIVQTALYTIQAFGNLGTHSGGEEVEPIESHHVEPCLSALASVIEWFVKTQCNDQLNTRFHGLEKNLVVGVPQTQKLLSQVEDVARGLEQILLASSHQVRAMQITTKNYFLRRHHLAGPHPLRDALDYAPETNLFHLDKGGDILGYDYESIGNLTGKGVLEDRISDFWAEVDMALSLTSQFQIARTVLPKVCWVYYTSAREFIYIAEWESSKKEVHAYSPELLTHEFFTKGQPDHNPTRSHFWTRPYRDEYGKGMMVTLGAPIDWDGRFLGTVALDLGVDMINAHLRLNDLPAGELVLANEHMQVIGHPYKTSSDDKEILSLAAVTSLTGLGAIDFATWKPREVRKLEERDVFYIDVEHTPWHLFCVGAL
jgi:hypothetical protein